MKNFQKITFVVIALLSHTAFAATPVQQMTPQEALLQAIDHEDLAGVQAAVKSGANINTPGRYGTTPLMKINLATTQTMSPIIPYLISAGASLTAQDLIGCTALDYALLGFTPATISFLESKKAPTGTNALVNAINQNNMTELEKLLEHGANPNLLVGGVPLLALLALSNAESSLQIAEILVKAGANVNQKDDFGNTALMSAAANNNNLPMVQFLLAKGAQTTPQANQTCHLQTALLVAVNQQNPSLAIINALIKAPDTQDKPHMTGSLNLQDSYGYTALMCAAQRGNRPVVEALLAAGAKTTPQTTPVNYSSTALLIAVATQSISIDMVEALLLAPDIKNSINLPDSNGWTPLMWAVSANNLPVTKALLAKKALTTPQANQANGSVTALMVATTTPLSLPIVEALLKAPDIKDSINLQDIVGHTALMDAIAYKGGNLSAVQALIAAKAKTTPQANQANYLDTALLIAVQQPISADMVKALLLAPDIKQSINMPDTSGWTALMWAANSGNPAIVSDLIAAGAKTTLQTNQANYSNTALIVAINQQNPSSDIIRVLLKASDAKDSVNLKNAGGQTALMWATNRGNLSAVQALLTAGADVTIITPQGQTALSLSAANCKPALQDALNNTLLNAVIGNDLTKVQKALTAGANPSLVLAPIAGTTTSVLIIAIGEKNTAIAEALIDAKANLDFQDTQGATALIIAASNGNLELVNSLLAAGANPNFQTNAANSSATALTTAATGNFTSVVEALAKAPTISRSINKQDSTGATALIYAAQAGNEAMIKALAGIKGINANIQDNTGMTALMYTASNNNGTINGDLLPILKLLVKIPGINLNVINNHMNESVQCGPGGCAAIDYAEFEGQNQDYATFLTNSGANPNL